MINRAWLSSRLAEPKGEGGKEGGMAGGKEGRRARKGLYFIRMALVVF